MHRKASKTKEPVIPEENKEIGIGWMISDVINKMDACDQEKKVPVLVQPDKKS